MPEDNKTPRPRIPVRWRVIPAALLLALVLMAGYLLLPRAAERFLVPVLFKEAGIRDYALPVRALSLFGMDLGTLRIGPATSPGILAAAIRVRYHPAGLLQGRLTGLTLDGVRIRIVEKPGVGFTIPGLPALGASAGEDQGRPVKLPVAIARVEVRQGEVLIVMGDRSILIPFEADLTPSPDMKILEGSLALKVPDQRLVVQGRIDLADNRLSVTWEGRRLRLGELARLVGLENITSLTGTGAVRGSLKGRLSPLKIETAKMTVSYTPCRLIWGDNRLDLSGATSTDNLRATINSEGTGVWAVEAGPVRLAAPSGEGHFTVTGRLENGADDRWTWQGRLAATVALAPDANGRSRSAWPLALETDADLWPDGRWQANFHVAESQPSGGEKKKPPGSSSSWPVLAGLTLSAEGERSPFKADIRWQLPALDWTQNGLRLRLEAVEGAAHYQHEGDAGNGTLAVTLGSGMLSAPAGTAHLEALRVSGQGRWSPGGLPRLSGEVVVGKGRFAAPTMGVQATGFSLRLPVAWPPPEKGKAGTLTLSAATWDGRALGAATGWLHQTAAGVSFEARHDSRLVPHLKVAARGEIGVRPDTGTPFAKISWTADRAADAPPLQVSELMPEPPGIPITFAGALSAKGEMTYENGLRGSLSAGVASGRLQVDDQGVVIEGIESALHIPDIGQLRSAPAQDLTFKAVSFGAVRVTDGRLAFQIEPGPAVFLEGGRFRWCGGTVIAPATRFVAGKNAYDLTVFCDRLKLDQLLEQLGMAQVEGGGAISGLIPVVLADGRLTFNNAFLYSSPGEGGVIRVQGSEVLTAGIPPGTPQYNQMELARYALKDYDYQWAKVSMNSVADDLLVQLQFDGKPAGPLPFIYQPESGGFVKAAPGQPGSVFQGIRLDVNITLPLNRMLRYRELFKRLQ
jgi:hypothetical protein